jgi:hypothetical protein
MATGPEHYREAEQLTESVTIRDALSGRRILMPGDHGDVLALAQVHATLALAAATALASADSMYYHDAEAWEDAAGLPRKAEAAGDQEVTF